MERSNYGIPNSTYSIISPYKTEYKRQIEENTESTLKRCFQFPNNLMLLG